MKHAISPQLVLSVSLLCLTGARAAPAAEPAVDGQEQARLLLAGKSFAVSDLRSRGAARSAAAALSPAAESPPPTVEPAADGQEQARLLLAGRSIPVSGPKSRGPARPAALPAAGSTSPVSDPQEQARRMILGSEFRSSSSGRVTAKMEPPRSTP